MRWLWAAAISGWCVALVLGCSSDTSADGGMHADTEQASCGSWVQRLLDCEVIAGSRLSGCEEDDPILPCAWACMQKATCTQIKASYCDHFLNSYAGCLNECNAMPVPFTCDDGTKLDGTKQCDGVSDCPNGEDEDCTQGYFTCDDGETSIPESWQCDNLVQCRDGADEAGCPPGPMLTCDTGESFPASAECNGYPDCPGGEDEVNCAKLTCD